MGAPFYNFPHLWYSFGGKSINLAIEPKVIILGWYKKLIVPYESAAGEISSYLVDRDIQHV